MNEQKTTIAARFGWTLEVKEVNSGVVTRFWYGAGLLPEARRFAREMEAYEPIPHVCNIRLATREEAMQ